MQALVAGGYTAKNLSTMLVDECDRLYGHKPGDDTTSCVVKIRRREPMNILFGPPSNRDDANRMMSLFFSKEGKHIICGGTTSSIASKYLGKPIRASLTFERSDVPPIAELEGVDLVTEGILTLTKTLEYLQRGRAEDDAAKTLMNFLLDSDVINFLVGAQMNKAHYDPSLPIEIKIRKNVIQQMAKVLEEKYLKKVNVQFI